jgi:hypothetical protein
MQNVNKVLYVAKATARGTSTEVYHRHIFLMQVRGTVISPDPRFDNVRHPVQYA